MNSKWIRILCIMGISAFSILLVAFVCWIYFDNNDIIDNDIDNRYNISRSDGNSDSSGPMLYTPGPQKAGKKILTENNSVIKSDTRYILQTFYVDATNGERLIEEEIPVPVEFIALNKKELQNYLDDYVSDMPLDEYLNGMISYEIIKFDENKLVLRKTYSNDWNRNEYYVCDSNGEVVVYYGDKKTVYEYTGIRTEDLSEDETIRLKLGCYVTNTEELYALLESFSS